jgi:hypothetical protein
MIKVKTSVPMAGWNRGFNLGKETPTKPQNPGFILGSITSILSKYHKLSIEHITLS